MFETAATVLGVQPQRLLNHLIADTARDLGDPRHGMLADLARGDLMPLRESSLPAVRRRFIAWAMDRDVDREFAEQLADPDSGLAPREKSLLDRAVDLITKAKADGEPVMHALCAASGRPKPKDDGNDNVRLRFTIDRDAADALDRFARQHGIKRGELMATVVALRAADLKRRASRAAA